MAKEIIDCISPILADIGLVAIFVSTVGMIINSAKNAFTKGEIRF